jgi:hypothetical protein
MKPILDEAGTLTKKDYDQLRNGSSTNTPTEPATKRSSSVNARRLAELLICFPEEVTAIELAGWRCVRMDRD